MRLPLLLLLACPPPKPAETADSVETAAPPETADSVETAAPPETADTSRPWVPSWPPYATIPSWTSTDPGYDTGGAFADIDGDGVLDLVVANGNDMKPGPIRVYLAAPDGTLPEAATWESARTAYFGHVAAGDVDGDGWTDIAAAIYLGPDGEDDGGGVLLYHNEGGALSDDPTWEVTGFYSFSVALGDVDNDGDLDLAATAGESYAHEPDADRLYLNRDGLLDDTPAWTSEPAWSVDVAFADADGSGTLDLVFARIGSPHALYLVTDGLPSDSPDWLAPGTAFEGNSVDFGDVNDDGALDLVISENQQQGGTGVVVLYCGPDLAPCWTSEDAPTYQSAVALRDLDGDGDLDLAAGAWWNPIRLYQSLDGVLETTPSFTTDTRIVAEALIFDDRDGADVYEEHVTGPGPLLALPRGCVVIATDTPGAVGDGYFSSPAAVPLGVTCRLSPALDLLSTDWEFRHGDDLYVHLPPG